MNAILPVSSGDENARADVESGQYERHRKLREGDRVLDLGAHVGYFTQYAIKQVGESGQVVAFEPVTSNFRKLWRELRYCANAELICAAVSDVDGESVIWENPLNSGGHSLTQYDPQMTRHDCHVYDIGRWCIRRKFVPDFVKVDTEGCEASILLSLFLSGLRPHIAFEAHSEKLWQMCNALLIANNYESIPGNSVVGINWARPL